MLPIDTISNLKQVSKPSNDLHKSIRSLFNYRPPEDYVWPDDGFDGLALEQPYISSRFIRDFASEGCFFDFEGGLEHV